MFLCRFSFVPINEGFSAEQKGRSDGSDLPSRYCDLTDYRFIAMVESVVSGLRFRAAIGPECAEQHKAQTAGQG